MPGSNGSTAVDAVNTTRSAPPVSCTSWAGLPGVSLATSASPGPVCRAISATPPARTCTVAVTEPTAIRGPPTSARAIAPSAGAASRQAGAGVTLAGSGAVSTPPALALAGTTVTVGELEPTSDGRYSQARGDIAPPT